MKTVTRTYRLYPNSLMKQVLDDLRDYRRYCWNQALELWQNLYDAHSIEDYILKIEFIPKYNKRTDRIKIAEKQYHTNPAPSWRKVRDMLVE